MNTTIKTHLISISYVLLAGVAFSWLSYFFSFKALALIEETSFVQVGAFFAILSPVIGPTIGSILFLHFAKTDLIPVNLWKYTILYSMILIVVLEIYLLKTDPIWSGLGIIVVGVGCIVLSLAAYLKMRKKQKDV